MTALIAAIIIGFIAQLLGGSLGMGYGVSASTGLTLAGFAPASSSSVIHVVEIATSAFNGTVHWRAKNVDWRVVAQIGIPGGIGAFTGAVLLSMLSLDVTKPWVGAILLILGIVILAMFLRGRSTEAHRRAHAGWLIPLGAVSGFFDSSAGGGWGVMTTSTLVVTKSMQPGRSAGTTSTARFLVAVAGTAGFLVGLGITGIDWFAVLGMVIGGIIALPIIRVVVRYVPQRTLGIVMGLALIALNARPIALAFHPETWVVVAAMILAPLVATGVILLTMRGAKATDA